MLQLGAVETLALAGLVLFLGARLRRWIPVLARYNLPSPVLGGLTFAVAMLILRAAGSPLPVFNTATRDPLMIAFFTSLGFGASLKLLRLGGPQVIRFLVIATGFAILQNALGALVTLLIGMPPLFGVLAGSVTLAGGPATGLAFAPLFENAGVPGAATIALAAAMFGIISGGLVGSPIGTAIIERHRLRVRGIPVEPARESAPEQSPVKPPSADESTSHALVGALVAILAALWAGMWVSRGFSALAVTLPAYIGAMLIAAALRNLDDATGWFGFSLRVIDDIGDVALSLFLAMAIMTLRLWELAGLALPLLIILAAQVALIAIACPLVFRLMGRDYDAAVMSGGFCGFMLGTTANSMAIMRALTERYGAAPRAFLVVPLVGTVFMDFTNAVLITGCLNLFGR